MFIFIIVVFFINGCRMEIKYNVWTFYWIPPKVYVKVNLIRGSQFLVQCWEILDFLLSLIFSFKINHTFLFSVISSKKQKYLVIVNNYSVKLLSNVNYSDHLQRETTPGQGTQYFSLLQVFMYFVAWEEAILKDTSLHCSLPSYNNLVWYI